MRRLRLPLLVLAALLALATAVPAAASVYVQEGPKVVPDDLYAWTWFADDVAVSSDGRTALASAVDSVRVLARASGGSWSWQATLTPPPALEAAANVTASALSGDGDTVVVGRGLEDGATHGAVWTFTRANGVWTQDAAPLSPIDADAPATGGPSFGRSAALSADGDTLLVGGASGGDGAAWAFTRQNGAWVQQGARLTADLPSVGTFANLVALSGDGDTALLGTWEPESAPKAAWAFRRSGSSWSQDGPRLVPDDGTVAGGVALDADGTVAMLSGFSPGSGAVMWSFRRGGGRWTQDGPHIEAPDGEGLSTNVALAADGETAAVGGDTGLVGSAWLFRHGGSGWTVDAKLVPTDALRNGSDDPSVLFGSGVALTPDAGTVLVGGPWDNGVGALWTFRPAAAALTVPRLRAFTGTAIPPGEIPASTVLDRGNAPTGTITYRLYPADAFCAGPPLQRATVPVNGNGVYPTQALSAHALGVYSVGASYSGDARNAPAATSCDDMQFQTIDGARLTFETRGTLAVGAPLTLVPGLAGGTEPSGELTLSVYGPSDPLCAKAPVLTRDATAHGGRVPAVTFAPQATGRLTVTVFYGGDAQNPPDAIGCGRSTIAIERASPAIAASASPPVAVGGAIGAAARVAGFHAGGTVTFLLFGPSDPGCAGRPLATVEAPLSDGVAQSEAFATTKAGAYHLVAAYAGDRSNRPAASACAAGAVGVARSRPALAVVASTPARGVLVDRVQLQGGFRPTGNVRFSLYGRRDPRCRRRPVFTALSPLDEHARAVTAPIGGAAAGRYQFVVRYDGDARNEATQTACGANPVRVKAAARRRGAARARRPAAQRRSVTVALALVRPAPANVARATIRRRAACRSSRRPARVRRTGIVALPGWANARLPCATSTARAGRRGTFVQRISATPLTVARSDSR